MISNPTPYTASEERKQIKKLYGDDEETGSEDYYLIFVNITLANISLNWKSLK